MDREQVIATVSATGFHERMAEDFALWLNAAYADPNKPSSGYYVRESDGFRYLEGETHETQDGRMKALDDSEGGAWAVARFWLGVYAERVEADHDAPEKLEVNTVAILLPQIDA